jgi:hypothetical protein
LSQACGKPQTFLDARFAEAQLGFHSPRATAGT